MPLDAAGCPRATRGNQPMSVITTYVRLRTEELAELLARRST
ncbi:hypothetical protein [Actinoplanes missouriensis]